MFSLIVTLIAIALVAALALATLYYGGSIFNTGAEAANAARIDAQSQQIMGAMELYNAEVGHYPVVLEDLVSANYLKSLPVAQATQAVSSAMAAGTTWLMAASGNPVIVTQPVSAATCMAFNKLNLGVSAVLAQVHSSALRQCYGASPSNLTILVAKSGADIVNVAGNSAAVVQIGPVLSTPVPPVTDTSVNGWSIFPATLMPSMGSVEFQLDGVVVSALSFAPTRDDSSSLQTISVWNTGNSPLVFSSEGASVSAPFALSNGNCAGATVSAGDFCSLTISFSPRAVQNYIGPSYSLSLLGSGVTLPSLPLTGSGTSAIVTSQGASLAAMQVSASGKHTCVVTTAGGVKCWGFNAEGELGDGSQTNSATAVDVAGLTEGVSRVVAGDEESCAITTSGGLKCWGDNSDGHLGVAGGGFSPLALDVPGLTSGAVAVAAGRNFGTCVVTAERAVKCWTDFGGMSTEPTDIVGLSSITSIGIGSQFACALDTQDVLSCWGAVDGKFSSPAGYSATPVPVITGVASFAAGDTYVCVVWKSGGGACSGQTAWYTEVVTELLPADTLKVASDYIRTCVLLQSGAAQCFSSGYPMAVLLNPVASQTGGTPSNILVDISVGEGHYCTVNSANSVQCHLFDPCGGRQGQLGAGEFVGCTGG